MVAGHLSEKNGYFYAVINYNDSLGNRKTKWMSTGLTVKGNKKRAEAILAEKRRTFQPDEPVTSEILFADFMEQWLRVVKSSIAVPTYASYTNMVKRVISPYFREKKTTLQGLTAKDIQDFYLKELDRVSACSVIHYHANIHKALKYAVKMDLIAVNPADKVERPKKEHFVGSFYDADEMNALFAASKGTKLEIPILFGAFYGLRRSEAIGLKWDAIDFEHERIVILGLYRVEITLQNALAAHGVEQAHFQTGQFDVGREQVNALLMVNDTAPVRRVSVLNDILHDRCEGNGEVVRLLNAEAHG